MTSTLQISGKGSEASQLPRDHSKGPPIRVPGQVPDPGSERRRNILKWVGITLVIAVIANFIWVGVTTVQGEREVASDKTATAETREAGR